LASYSCAFYFKYDYFCKLHKKNVVQLEVDLTLKFASLYEKLATMEMPYG
jgi:hypothetical protein